MGKPRDPDYWRKWRAAHPEYRAREVARTRARPRGDRAAEYARQRERRAEQRAIANGDNGHTEDHPLLAMARAIVRAIHCPDLRALLHRPVHDDAVGAAALALVAGEDPEAAARDVIRDDIRWLHQTAPFLMDGSVDRPDD